MIKVSNSTYALRLSDFIKKNEEFKYSVRVYTIKSKDENKVLIDLIENKMHEIFNPFIGRK
ncbi:MAG: hypothetical protein Q4A42_02170 [Tissierellia bacterium]|nr:hypothetical protein [Tissierellia bacterium]